VSDKALSRLYPLIKAFDKRRGLTLGRKYYMRVPPSVLLGYLVEFCFLILTKA
jgi:hypothetical protein